MKDELNQLRTVRLRTLDMIQKLSQEQMSYAPEPEEWSVAEIVDHLILSEQFLRGEIEILIKRAKSGEMPYLYRSFAEFNVRPAFIPECALRFFEAPLGLFNMFTPSIVRNFVVRNAPFRALAPDVSQPRPGRSKVELCEELRAALHETEILINANLVLDYDRMRHHHPLFGMQTASQLMRTLSLHEQAHQDQIAQVLSNSGFSKTK